MEERWATVSGGRMRYLVGGTGEPLVLVHGIAASSFSYRLNWGELAQRFRVFVPDLMHIRGGGRREKLDGSLRGNARRMAEFLDDVGLQRADILGTSHGGAVVMELAAMVPERFERMILIAPANPFARRYHRVLRFYQSAAGAIFTRIVPFMPGRAWNYGIGRMYADSRRVPAGTGIGYARPLRARGAIRHIVACIESFAEDVEGLRAKLPKLAKIPTLVIWGDRDPVVEVASGHHLRQALQAEIAVMHAVGHLPYEESPQEFNRIVIEWLEKPSRSPDAL